MRTSQQLLSREGFIHFISNMKGAIVVPAPHDIVPCRCGDANCHGWRIVERRRRLALSIEQHAAVEP